MAATVNYVKTHLRDNSVFSLFFFPRMTNDINAFYFLPSAVSIILSFIPPLTCTLFLLDMSYIVSIGGLKLHHYWTYNFFYLFMWFSSIYASVTPACGRRHFCLFLLVFSSFSSFYPFSFRKPPPSLWQHNDSTLSASPQLHLHSLLTLRSYHNRTQRSSNNITYTNISTLMSEVILIRHVSSHPRNP